MNLDLSRNKVIEQYLADLAGTADVAKLQAELCSDVAVADLFAEALLFDNLLKIVFSSESNATGRKFLTALFLEDADVDLVDSATKASRGVLQNTDRKAASNTFPPVVVLPDRTSQGMPDYSFHAWSLAYLVATVFLAVGLVIGMAVRISNWRPEQVAEKSLPLRQIVLPIEATTVGCITDLADCRGRQWSAASKQWSEIPRLKSEIINPKYSVSDRFVLSSGLMEITYDTGAKVILEGPCTYEIESTHSGYLAVGKLTAKVEKGAGTRGQEVGKTLMKLDMQGPISHGPWPLPPAPLFAVRTPTAVVTDLGTEFGVEVEKLGATRSYVFQGKVELRENCRNRANSEVPVDILYAGESARVERGRNNKIIITREPGQPKQFVRQLPASSVQLGKSPSVPVSRPAFTRYRLVDLGGLGSMRGRVHAINVAGWAVGEVMTAKGTKAFLYADGRMKALDIFHGEHCCAYDINAFGQIAGYSGNRLNDSRAFLHGNEVTKELGTLGGRGARAFAINDVGAVVGVSLNPDGILRAFLYTTGRGMKDLGALGGPKARSWAYGVNRAGLVVGCSEIASGHEHAFLYDPASGMKDLGTLGGNSSVARRINDAGQVVGSSEVGDGSRHAFFYDIGTGMKDLGTLGGPNSAAIDINNLGQVVGSAECLAHGDIRTHSFLYSDGKMIDLNSLVDPATGWTRFRVNTIQNSGQIAGLGTAPDGNPRVFLLTPVKGSGGGN